MSTLALSGSLRISLILKTAAASKTSPAHCYHPMWTSQCVLDSARGSWRDSRVMDTPIVREFLILVDIVPEYCVLSFGRTQTHTRQVATEQVWWNGRSHH
jgi:hypothetical protein